MDDQVFKLSVALVIVVFIVTIFYCLTLFNSLQKIPKEKHQFPSWFVWLFLIPWVGFVFQFIMLPFGIPNTLKKVSPNDQAVVDAANMLFKVGLAEMILTLFGFFLPIHPINQIAAILGMVLWIVYWVLIVRFRNKYLK
jgi:hypothetical protein